MKKRKPKKSDQEQVEKAFDLLYNIVQENPHIEPTLWASAMWSCLVNVYINSGTPHKEFCEETEKIKEHYKNRWDK